MAERCASNAGTSNSLGVNSTLTSLLNCSTPAWACGCVAAMAATAVLTKPVMVRKSSAGRAEPYSTYI